MNIERITGAPGSGKTTKLNAIAADLDAKGVPYIVARGNSSVVGILQAVERSRASVVLIDDCPEKLLAGLEQSGAGLTVHAVVQS